MAKVTQQVDFRISAQDQASGVFAKVGRGLDDLKKVAGNRGPLKDVAELLAGGGAIAGLSFGASILREMSEEAVKLRDEFNAGTISAGELTERLVAALPVFGQIRQAGLAIRELITGEAAEARAIAQEAGATNAFIDIQNKYRAEGELRSREHLLTLRDIRQEEERIGLAAAEAGRVAAEQAFERRTATIKDQADREKANDPNRGEREAAQAKLKVAQAAAEARAEALKDPVGITPEGLEPINDPEYRAAIDARDQAARQLEQLKRASGERNADIERKQGEEEQAAAKLRDKALQEAAEEQARAREKLQRDHELRLSRIRSEARAESLAEAGQQLEAETEKIGQALAEQEAAVRGRLEEALRNDPGNASALKEQAAAERLALNQAATAAYEQAKKTDIESISRSAAAAAGQATALLMGGGIADTSDRQSPRLAAAESGRFAGDIAANRAASSLAGNDSATAKALAEQKKEAEKQTRLQQQHLSAIQELARAFQQNRGTAFTF